MQKKLIIIFSSIIVLILTFFLLINKNSLIIDKLVFSGGSLEDTNIKTLSLLEEKLREQHDGAISNNMEEDYYYRHIATIINDNIYDMRYIRVDEKGNYINIFASYNITLLKTSLKKIVIEETLDYNIENDIQKLGNLEGEYKVILGEGYDWVGTVVFGP